MKSKLTRDSTYCERQIVHPGNSTLYCSRAYVGSDSQTLDYQLTIPTRCQRRDSAKPTPIEAVVSPAFISAPSYFDVPQPDILPQRSPTVLRPLSSTFSDLHLSETSSSDDSNNEPADRSKRLSDATNYHNRLDSSPSTSPLPRRPHATRSSTSTLPSLSHTPSSSVGTAASYTFPPRHRPTKSADLVIPVFAGPASAKSEASTLTSFHAAEAEYPKHRDWRPRQGSATGSLRQLFRHEAVAGSPPRQLK